MPNKHYNRGSAFERRIKRELEDAGYYVTKSGGSKGPVDLSVVDRSGYPYFLQCRKDGRMSKEDFAKLDKLGKTFNIPVILVCKPKRNEPVKFEDIYYLEESRALNTEVLGWQER